MGKTDRLLSKPETSGELLAFLWRRKLWRLIPMVVLLILFGLILIFAQSSAAAPFIYTLF